MKKSKKIIVFILFVLLSLSIGACNNTLEETPTGDNVGSFGTYENLKAYLDENHKNDGSNINMLYGANESALDATSDAATPGVNNDGQNTAVKDYSRTNNQVNGVEEADKILTDGYRIYILSGNKFFIVDADTLAIDFEYQIITENASDTIYSYGSLDNMYLYDNKVILMSYISSYWVEESTKCSVFADEDSVKSDNDADTSLITEEEPITADPDQTYYCNNYHYSYGTKVMVFDVTDTTNVTITRELYFDSAYVVDTRMIDSQLYLIFNNYMVWDEDGEDLYIPKYKDSAVSEDFIQLPASEIYFMPNDGNSFGYLMFASFDVTKTDGINVKAYLGNTWQIYMSLNNLYTVINKYNYNEDTQIYDYFTYILRFEIVDGELVYKAIADIKGYPLNQFSMDEYNGVFRIVTTENIYSMYMDETGDAVSNPEDTSTNGEPSWQVNNYLYCLDATSEDDMTELSVTTDIGKPGERIYSARFNEEYAYIVTYENVDPLYKYDLTNPQNPVLLGQLEEPGVSDYLHMINDNLMIGIGRGTQDEDGWTRFIGVKVSLYDTSANNPVNVDNYLVAGQYSYTNVMWDHKSFVYFTPQGKDYTYVAIPVYEYFEDYWGYSQSMYVFKVNQSGSLEFLTKLSHMEKDNDGYYSYFDTIERAVMIDNYIYTVSYSKIEKFDMNNNFTEINSQVLNPDYYQIWGYLEVTSPDGSVD